LETFKNHKRRPKNGKPLYNLKGKYDYKNIYRLISLILFSSCGVNEPQEVPGVRTTFKFSLNEKSNVKVDVINSYDTHIKTLIESELQAGVYQVTWNSTNNNNQKVVDGIYFFELFINGNFIERKPIIMEIP